MNARAALGRTLAFLATLLLSATAQAQIFRAYLAIDGNDANPCTLPAPCRLLPAALNAIASGGEIWMLDSANYNTGPVNITKSVSILAVPGAVGSVVANGGTAISIATAGVKVALRNLVIVPLPGAGGTSGISMTNGAGLTVENCLIANLPQSGIVVNTAAIVRVADTTIRDNGVFGLWLLNGVRGTVTRTVIAGNGDTGIWAWGTVAASATTVNIADSTIDGSAFGVSAISSNASAQVKVSIQNSKILRNANFGLLSQSEAGAGVTIASSYNIVSNNGSGIANRNSGSKVWASGNTVVENGIGLDSFGGIFESAGNNAVRNNGTDTSGTIAAIATK